MKNILRLGILAALLTVVASSEIEAQCFVNPDTGQLEQPDGTPCPNVIATAVPFLRIVGDARSGAMGDVGIGISPDANAVGFNSSKLAFAKENLGISATYTPWLQALGLNDVYMAYLTGYTKLSEQEAVGLGLRYFKLGEINFTDVNGEPLGVGNPNEFEIKASYARQLSDNFAASLGAKYIYSNLASGQQVGGTEINAGTSFAADLSFTYMNDEVQLGDTESTLMVGVAVTNIGSKITYTNASNDQRDFIPTNLGLGAGWTFAFDDFNELTVAVDFNKLLVPTPCEDITDDGINDCDEDGDGIPEWKEESPIGGIFSSFGDAPDGFGEELNEISTSFGLEYWYDQQFAVRAGYYTEHETKGNRKFLTVGLGLKYNIFGLNFSYLVPTTNQRNPLDNTLRFSLLFDFGAFDPGAGE